MRLISLLPVVLLMFSACDRDKDASATGPADDSGDLDTDTGTEADADTDTDTDTDTDADAFPDLVVADIGTSSLHGFDTDLNLYMGELVSTGMSQPTAMRFGPGGLMVTEADVAGGTGAVYSVDISTWTLTTYVDSTAYPSLTSAMGIEQDLDGNILVSSHATDEILRFAGPDIESSTGFSPGDFMSVFVAAGAGGLDGPTHIIYTLDGATPDLLVSSSETGDIKRYDGTTGAYIDDFIPSTSIGTPGAITYHPMGSTAKMYVTDIDNNSVVRFDPGVPGSPETFVSEDVSENGQLSGPTGIFFGMPAFDSSGTPLAGHVFVSSSTTGYVNRYEDSLAASPGAFVDTIDTAATALTTPMGLAVIQPFGEPGPSGE